MQLNRNLANVTAQLKEEEETNEEIMKKYQNHCKNVMNFQFI